MRSPPRNLPKAIARGDWSLTRLLLQTRAIAAKLGLHNLESWLKLELNGYPADIDLPPCRRVSTKRLEVFNQTQNSWLFAGHLHYTLTLQQPIEQIENWSREEWVSCPVSRNFSLKNDFGDSFGSDWPQRFVVLGSEYQAVMEAVAKRWSDAFEQCGLRIYDPRKLVGALDALGDMR